MKMPGFRSLFQNFLLFLAALFLSLAALEIACRLLFRSPEAARPKVFVHETSDNLKLLYRPSPNASNNAYDVLNLINSAGFRDREFSLEKPAGRLRIEFLGDSVVYGYGLLLEDTLAKQLENEFRANGRNAEVLNLGVSGYESEQAVEFFKEVGLAYKPDVVIAGYTLNDSRYASMELDFFSEFNAQVRESGADLLKNIMTWLYDHSRFLQVLDRKLKIQKKVKELRSYQAPIRRYLEDRNRKNRDPEGSEYRKLEAVIEADGRRLGVADEELSMMLRMAGFRPPFDLESSHWNVSKQAFLELARLSRERGFKAVVVIFPYMLDLERYALAGVHEFLSKEFRAMGFEVIDLKDCVQNLYAQYGNKICMDSVHFSPFGTHQVGKYLYDEMVSRGIVPADRKG